MAPSVGALLRELEGLKTEFGGNAARRKLALLPRLRHGRLARAADVLALHEQLCFMRAYPDDAAVLQRVEQLLLDFDRRSDLRRFAEHLADTGIAGTSMHYAFYAPTARWLARRWGDRLHIDWENLANTAQLDELLHHLALWAETPGLDESADGAREWIERMRGPDETDAAFLVRSFAGLDAGELFANYVYEQLDPPLRLAAGPDTPSRTRAKHSVDRVTFQTGPLRTARPELPAVESVYGIVTLKNGIPIGYGVISALFGSSEIAYSVFESFRGGEAGHIYGAWLATAHHLFGSTTFTIFPYQLGDGNDEALQSGAWWFYQKLGFRPRNSAVTRLMRRELAAMAKRPRHRSTIATLRRLACENLYYDMARPRDDVIGELHLGRVGEAVTGAVAKRFGSNRRRAAHVLTREARSLLGLSSLDGWDRSQRLVLQRWAPLISVLPGVSRWSSSDRRALAEVVHAKGSRRESDYVSRFDAHRRLRRAVVALAQRTEG